MLSDAVLFIRHRWASWLFLTVLTVATVWSARIALQSKPNEAAQVKGPSLKHESDFEATGLVAWRTSADGLTRSQIRSQQVVHYRDDLSSTYTAFWVQSTRGNTTTTAESKTAMARNDGELVVLQQQASIQRNQPRGTAAELAQLSSETIALYPDKGVAASRSPSTFKQGQRTVLAAGGFDYQDTQANIAMYGPVKSTVLPRPNLRKP